ncbi:hypothetical protein NPIL_556691 [Nephila pilipes]|uniref:Uncharacterized protein n=1 Tax=Nephila pilipes TaxID=299642 RepID=A0A8X6N0Z9_NEPPI|nr:hypothetical protein NPIL_556691 [Nephila pilipes]
MAYSYDSSFYDTLTMIYGIKSRSIRRLRCKRNPSLCFSHHCSKYLPCDMDFCLLEDSVFGGDGRCRVRTQMLCNDVDFMVCKTTSNGGENC